MQKNKVATLIIMTSIMPKIDIDREDNAFEKIYSPALVKQVDKFDLIAGILIIH
jgi:hypothetical protein